MRKVTTLVLIAAVALGLAACGRKGKPIPPEGSTYPRRYPDIQFPPAPPSAEQTGTESQSQ